jgi:dienelactone hydrolase
MLATALCLLLQTQQPFIPTWTGLQAPYQYEHFAPGVVKESTASADGATRVLLTFPGSTGDTVHGVLMIPAGAGPKPCVVLLHGVTSNKEAMEKFVGASLLQKGIAYAAIDAPGHGQRMTSEDSKIFQQIGGAIFSGKVKGDLLASVVASDTDGTIMKFLGRAVKNGVVDNRHLLDYLTTRKDLDYHRFGLEGNSMGSIMATILAAVDNRVQCAALLVGGDPALPLLSQVPKAMQEESVFTCASLYAPHDSRPVLMLNGNKDTIMPRSATDRLYAAFPEGKKHISWYVSNHFLPALAVEEATQWEADKLGVKG